MLFPDSLKTKLPDVGTTIFSVMSKLATEYNAINLSQGFPDFESDPVLIDLVSKYMKKGYNQYAPMAGVPPLLDVLSEKIFSLYGVRYDKEKEITITPGATYAIFTAIASVVHEDDEVIIFTPAYDCYAPAIETFGGKPVYIQLNAPDYKIKWNSVRNMLSKRTRLIIINTPHNPTGSVLTDEDMFELQKLTKGTNILVLSDEVYEHITFDKIEHRSVISYPDLAERSFVIFSFGKTFHNTGWKMGYCVAPENLTSEFRKIHQFNVFSCNSPIQYALAEYLENPEHYMGLNKMYEEKRNFFRDNLATSRFKVIPCHGTYFILLEYSEITDEKDTDFAVRLTKEFGVASIPVSVFYYKNVDNKVLRFCFAKQEETLAKATEILCRI